jgi:hypothetical protein
MPHRPNIDFFLANLKSAWQQAARAESEIFKEPNSAFTSERDLGLKSSQVIGSVQQYLSEEMAADSSPPISFPDVEISNVPTISVVRLCTRNFRCDPHQERSEPGPERHALFQFLFYFCKRTRYLRVIVLEKRIGMHDQGFDQRAPIAPRISGSEASHVKKFLGVGHSASSIADHNRCV